MILLNFKFKPVEDIKQRDESTTETFLQEATMKDKIFVMLQSLYNKLQKTIYREKIEIFIIELTIIKLIRKIQISHKLRYTCNMAPFTCLSLTAEENKQTNQPTGNRLPNAENVYNFRVWKYQNILSWSCR